MRFIAVFSSLLITLVLSAYVPKLSDKEKYGEIVSSRCSKSKITPGHDQQSSLINKEILNDKKDLDAISLDSDSDSKRGSDVATLDSGNTTMDA